MIKQNPFSIYDFMGYFIPGAMLIYIYLIINFIKEKNEFSLLEFLNKNDSVQLQNLLFFLIISYSLGHFVNFASSITVEKYANWKYNYPSKYLLDLKHEGYWSGDGVPNKIKKTIIPILLFPVLTMDFLLGYLLGFRQFYTKKLDVFLINVITGNSQLLIKKIYKNYLMSELDNGVSNEKLKFEMELDDKDFHRVISHYTFENSKKHQFRLVNYVALYGFLRSLTLIVILVFWYLVYYVIKYVKIEDYNYSLYFFVFLIISFVSYVFFMAFMKFYRRYSLEGLMLIAIDEKLLNLSDKEINDIGNIKNAR